MINKNINFLDSKKYYLLVLFFVVVLFLLLRLPAIHRPYHQDEYKWVMYSHPEIIAPGTVPHPPLTEFIYTKIAPVFGDNGFRFVPLSFSLINLFLIFYFSKEHFKDNKLFIIPILFTFSFYSVLSSTMVDVDGAVMPMFLLTLFISYFSLKEKDFNIKTKQDWFWLSIMIASAIGGFFVKVSGVLPIIAIFIDFLIEKKIFSDLKKVLKYGGFAIMGAAFLVVLLLAAKLIFPFFNLEYSLKYWEHFAVFKNRGWMQTFIQFVKSILYVSPFFVLSLFFVTKDIFKKTRPFFIFIFAGLVFYLFLFDFSLGALDRYFEFLVIPLCFIVGEILISHFSDFKKVKFPYLLFTAVVLLVINFLQYLPQAVPSLYPKSEWVGRIISLKWNFLYPFFGGSGPLGFYISFMFIGLMWIFGFGLVLFGLIKKDKISTALLLLALLGFVYNGIFIQEYLFGTHNGSASKMVFETVEYIKSNPDIKRVLVYNDNGGFNIQQIGKYERRLYAVPGFESTYEPIFKNFDEYIMYIDIPHVMKGSLYDNYFNSCKVIYSQTDKYITSKVLDCEKLKK